MVKTSPGHGHPRAQTTATGSHCDALALPRVPESPPSLRTRRRERCAPMPKGGKATRRYLSPLHRCGLGGGKGADAKRWKGNSKVWDCRISGLRDERAGVRLTSCLN